MAQGKRVTAELGVLIKANNKLSGQVQKARRDVSGFKKQLKGLGGVIAGAFAVGAIVAFTRASIRAFDIQAKAQASLLVALKGNVVAQQELIQQAKILQKTTLFGDEATIQAQAMLASMGLQAQEIKKLIPLVQDFATLQKLDLATAANLVAKSVGSSTNALTRYGIQIEGAVGSSERLESAVKAMNEKVGGQAAAAAAVGAGELQQLSNLWEDFTETIGSVIAKGLIPLASSLKSVVSELDTMLSLLSGDRSISVLATQINVLNTELDELLELEKRQTFFDRFLFGDVFVRVNELQGRIKFLNAELEKTNRLAANSKFVGPTGPLPLSFDSPFGAAPAGGESPIKRIKTEIAELASLGPKLFNVTLPNALDSTRNAFTELVEGIQIYRENLEKAADTFEKLMEAQQIAAATAIAANFEQAKSLEDFGRIAINVAKQIISAEIAKGVAGAVRSALTNVPFPFNIIAAGVAAGAATALFNAAIPSFAGGVQNFSGGLAVVGERGPELVNLPRGSDVIPNNRIGGNLTIIVEGNLIGTEHELGRVVTNALTRFNQDRG